jgi:F-type H+-transporting ATPase subunit delta
MSLTQSEIEVLSTRYAKALFSLAEDNKKIDNVVADVSSILELNKSSREFNSVVENPILPKAQVVELIDNINKKAKFNEITVNFLKLIFSERRNQILLRTIDKFQGLVREKENLIIAEVFSSKKVDKKTEDKISKNLKSNIGKDIEVRNIIDEKIIGGLKIKVGSILFDDSLKSKLDKLQKELAS